MTHCQDISLRLATLPVPKTAPSFPAYKFHLSTQSTAPDLVLPQLITVRTLINNCLDIIDVSRWTGQANDAHFISGQIRLLNDNLTEARLTLKGEGEYAGGNWNEGNSADENVSCSLRFEGLGCPLQKVLRVDIAFVVDVHSRSASKRFTSLFYRGCCTYPYNSNPSTSCIPHLSHSGFSNTNDNIRSFNVLHGFLTS